MNIEDLGTNKVKDVIYLDDAKSSMIEGFKNGYALGKTTYFHEVDNHFRWLRQNVIIFGGFGNHGKSTFLYQLLLARAMNDGEKSAIFSPENMPVDYFYNDLIHTMVGMSTIKQHSNQMSMEQYQEAMEFIKDHFFMVYPENCDPTPEYINNRFKAVIDAHGVDFCVTDPFNQLNRDWETSGRDDRYISDYLSKDKRFAIDNNIHKITVAHCHSRVSFEEDGSMKDPNVYSLAGGAMWSNKADDIVFIHRPYKHVDPTNKMVYFISDKIKKQRICGQPGTVVMSFDTLTNRYTVEGKDLFNIETRDDEPF